MKKNERCFYLKFNKRNVYEFCFLFFFIERWKLNEIDCFVLFWKCCVNRMEIIKDSRGFYMTHYVVPLQNATNCLLSNSMDFFCQCLFCLLSIEDHTHTHTLSFNPKENQNNLLSYKIFLHFFWNKMAHAHTPHVFEISKWIQ